MPIRPIKKWKLIKEIPGWMSLRYWNFCEMQALKTQRIIFMRLFRETLHRQKEQSTVTFLDLLPFPLSFPKFAA
jgi:hypothetical protein